MVDPFIAFINTGGVDGKAIVNERGRPLFAKRVDDMMCDGEDGNDDNIGDHGRRNDGDNCDDSRKRNGAVQYDGDETNINGVEGNRSGDSKRFKSTHISQQVLLSDDQVRDAITPLWRLSYKEQLVSKAREMVNKCATKIVKEIKAKFR